MKPLRVNNKYQLDVRLGGGSYGEVYQGKYKSKDLIMRELIDTAGHDLQSGQEVALKLEYTQIDPSHLENEVEIYKELSGRLSTTIESTYASLRTMGTLGKAPFFWWSHMLALYL
jgi:serine/threonine protein kinase